MFKYRYLYVGMSPMSVKMDVWDVAGAGASLIGGLFTNSTNKKIAREQMALQERMFNTQMDYTRQAEQRQYDYADKAWNREAAYNDPAAQKARFEAAGLNPALMMEGQNAAIGSAESVSSPSPPSPPSLQSYQVQDPITPAVQTFLQSRAISAQARKAEEEANQVGIDNRTREVQNMLVLEQMRQDINKTISERQKNGADTKYLETMRDYVEEQLAIMEQSHYALATQENQKAYLLNQQGQEVEEKVKALQIDNFFRKLEHVLGLRLTRASIDNLRAQIDLTNAMSKTEAAKYAKTILEAAGLSPGSPQWDLREKEVIAALMNAGRTGLPFGISIPGKGDVDNNSPNPLPPYLRYW